MGSARVALDVHRLERPANDAAGLGCCALMFGFGPFCMAHSLVMAAEICSVRQDGNQSERNLRRLCSCLTCTIRSGKPFLRTRSRFLELIGSVVAAAPADYTRYL